MKRREAPEAADGSAFEEEGVCLPGLQLDAAQLVDVEQIDKVQLHPIPEVAHCYDSKEGFVLEVWVGAVTGKASYGLEEEESGCDDVVCGDNVQGLGFRGKGSGFRVSRWCIGNSRG